MALDEERDEVTNRAGDPGRRDLDRGLDHGGVQVREACLEALLYFGHLARFVCWVHQHRIGGDPGGRKQIGGSHPIRATSPVRTVEVATPMTGLEQARCR